MEYSASSEDLQRTIHAHPTLAEALHEAALAADKRAIDIPNRYEGSHPLQRALIPYRPVADRDGSRAQKNRKIR
jgi:hypothetical protein